MFGKKKKIKNDLLKDPVEMWFIYDRSGTIPVLLSSRWMEILETENMVAFIEKIPIIVKPMCYLLFSDLKKKKINLNIESISEWKEKRPIEL